MTKILFSPKSGILEAIVFVGGMVAQLTSGFWIEKLGFTAPYWFIFGCEVFALVYAAVLVPESKCPSKEERGKLFSLDNLKSSWKVYKNAVGTKKRNLIILTFCCGIMAIPIMSIRAVSSLFLLYSPLCFSPERVGYFSALQNSVYGVGGIVTIKAFGMCLSHVNVVRVSILSYLGFLVYFGFSRTLLMVFLSK